MPYLTRSGTGQPSCRSRDNPASRWQCTRCGFHNDGMLLDCVLCRTRTTRQGRLEYDHDADGSLMNAPSATGKRPNHMSSSRAAGTRQPKTQANIPRAKAANTTPRASTPRASTPRAGRTSNAPQHSPSVNATAKAVSKPPRALGTTRPVSVAGVGAGGAAATNIGSSARKPPEPVFRVSVPATPATEAVLAADVSDAVPQQQAQSPPQQQQSPPQPHEAQPPPLREHARRERDAEPQQQQPPPLKPPFFSMLRRRSLAKSGERAPPSTPPPAPCPAPSIASDSAKSGESAPASTPSASPAPAPESAFKSSIARRLSSAGRTISGSPLKSRELDKAVEPSPAPPEAPSALPEASPPSTPPQSNRRGSILRNIGPLQRLRWGSKSDTKASARNSWLDVAEKAADDD